MSAISVRWDSLDALSSELSQVKKQMDGYRSSIQGIRQKLPFAIQVQSNVSNSLWNLDARIRMLNRKLDSLSAGLKDAAATYRGTEDYLCGRTSDPPAEPKDDPWWKQQKIWKMFKGAGIAGGFATTLLDTIFGSDPWYLNVANWAKLGVGVAKDVVTVTSKDSTTTWAEALFGLANTAKNFDPTKSIFSQSIADQLSKYKGNGTTAGTLGAIAKWGGLAISLVSNGLKNYDEYKNGDISGGRAVAETIGETAVDFGTDLLLTAGITAGLVAVCGGAPALVVAGGVVLVKWGLDAVTEHFFGKKFSETVSDAVLDAGEWIIDKAGDVIDTVSQGVSDLVDGVSDCIGGAVDAVKDTGRKISALWSSVFG